MKKIVVFCVFFICILVFSVFADLAAKQAELKKVWLYVQELDTKIIVARDKNQTEKVIELKDLKRMAMIRANDLKTEITKEESNASSAPIVEPQEKVIVKEVVLTEAKRTAGFIGKLGFGGGGLLAAAGYTRPLNANADLIIDAGLAMGNQYSVMMVDLAAKIWREERFVGFGLTYANYSETVSDIPGISGNIEKGGKIGAEIFGGTMLDTRKSVQVGYNTVLGLVASVGYKF